jgi:glycosyltransferase involved in cell wall biosynthesis
MKIHVWVPDYAATSGGIKVFSRWLVRGLRELLPAASIVVFSKNDTSYPDSTQEPADEVNPFGWWSPRQRTIAFASTLFIRAARDRPDLIISTHVNFAVAARMLQRFFRTPFWVVGHGVDVWEVSNARMREALRSANVLLAVSVFTRARMAATLDINTDRISLLPDTFDSEKFETAPKPRFLLNRYGLHPDQPVIFTVGRLEAAEQYKGYDQVLRALPAILRIFPTARYILGGRGPDRARIESLIRELDVGNAVILAGYIADHELCSYYNLCDVFVMPSKGEGFGIVFLEALACGKPVVAGNKDASVEAVLDGKLGVLVDPDNPREIADAVIQILSQKHPNKVLQEPDMLRRQVIEAYGYDRFVAKLDAILATMAKLKSKTRNPKF